MKRSAKEKLIPWLAMIFALAVFTGLTLSFFKENVKPVAVFIFDTVVILVFALVWLSLSLKKSLSETIYSYENVTYIGAIFFSFTLLISVLFDIVSRLSLGNELSAVSLFHILTDFPMRFSMFAIPVMILVSLSLGISNAALIRHEGFRVKNMLSVLIAAFYIGGTIAIYFLSVFLSDHVSPGFDVKLITVLNTYVPLFLLLLMCYFECMLVGCAIMGYAATRKIPSYDKDYIIILGCSIDKKGGLLPLLKGRANRAVRFAWDQEIASGKPCRYVPSGGQGPGEIMSEGSAMEFYLLTHGAEQDEVFPEKKSADTYENMLFSKELIESMTPGAKIAFATTNYHVFRSGIIARQVGLDAEGIASSTKWYFWPNGFVREFIGILAINKKAHIITAVICAAVCTALAVVSYFTGLA